MEKKAKKLAAKLAKKELLKAGAKKSKDEEEKALDRAAEDEVAAAKPALLSPLLSALSTAVTSTDNWLKNEPNALKKSMTAADASDLAQQQWQHLAEDLPVCAREHKDIEERDGGNSANDLEATTVRRRP